MCGAGKIAAGVKQTFVTFLKEQNHLNDEDAVKLFDKIMNGRYATDIFE